MAEERISISRDALRAELSQLELRLVQSLASKSEVERLVTRVENLEERTVKREGPLMDQLREHEKTIKNIREHALTVQDVNEVIAESLKSNDARGWSTKERGIQVVLFLITVATFLVTVRGL